MGKRFQIIGTRKLDKRWDIKLRPCPCPCPSVPMSESTKKLAHFGPGASLNLENSEYLGLSIQFGFVILFSSAFPLAPLFAVILNFLKIRTNAKQLTKYSKRTTPKEIFIFSTSFYDLWYDRRLVLGDLWVTSVKISPRKRLILAYGKAFSGSWHFYQ